MNQIARVQFHSDQGKSRWVAATQRLFSYANYHWQRRSPAKVHSLHGYRIPESQWRHQWPKHLCDSRLENQEKPGALNQLLRQLIEPNGLYLTQLALWTSSQRSLYATFHSRAHRVQAPFWQSDAKG